MSFNIETIPYTCIYHNEYYLHHFILGTCWPKWECFDCKRYRDSKQNIKIPDRSFL